MRRKRRGLGLVPVLLLCLALFGCQSDAITQETKDAVSTKTKDVLTLYASTEELVKQNSIEVDQSFYDMKGQLETMSKKVAEKLEDATEQDGKQALRELQKIEDNLNATKSDVEEHIAVK